MSDPPIRAEKTAWTWVTCGVTVYAVDTEKLALYDPLNDRAWIGTERAVDLREWA